MISEYVCPKCGERMGEMGAFEQCPVCGHIPEIADYKRAYEVYKLNYQELEKTISRRNLALEMLREEKQDRYGLAVSVFFNIVAAFVIAIVLF